MNLQLPRGTVRLPAFLPDATRGFVRGADASDLREAGAEALVMNVFHLAIRPGAGAVKALGGLHALYAWNGPILTDSGGFQAYSLIRQNPSRGSVTDRGLTFLPEGRSRPVQLTPEKSLHLQLAFGADIAVCLDDCTHAEAPLAEQEAAVERTLRWARLTKTAFERLVPGGKQAASRPLLFGVVQGGGSAALRKRCAEALLETGFDGFGFGGWPFTEDGSLLREMLAAVREFIPPAYPLHALGVGHPEHVAACVRLGYTLFDSALPTRDARSGRLYAGVPGERLQVVYIDDGKHTRERRPIQEGCDCRACASASLGFLRHLRVCGDPLFARLATIHNLRYMFRLMEHLRDRTN